MIKINSIRLKCLLFEIGLITLLITFFSYITLNLIISDKTDQAKESIAYQNVTTTNIFKNYSEQIQVLFSIAENEFYRGRMNADNATFFQQFKLLKGLVLKENGDKKIILDGPAIEEIYEENFVREILLADTAFDVTYSEDKSIFRVEKGIGKGGNNSLILYFSLGPITKIFDSNMAPLSGQVLFDENEIILSQTQGVEDSVISKISKLKFASDNLIIKNISSAKSAYSVACNKQEIGYRFCYFSDRENSQKIIYNLSFKYLIYFIAVSSFLGIITLVLLRRFTKPIESLTKNAIEVAKGNLDVESEVRSQDEIGKLSLSFNFMTKKLKEYIEEVKDKIRMEEELNIANTVQNYFFPSKELMKFGEVEVKGLHLMASECGGDWWGVREIEGNIVLFLGDATGHGVPSALITSAVYSSANMLEDMYKSDPSVIQPHNILSILNKTVHSLGQEILMTFFVAVIPKGGGKLLYSNASHNHPFLVNEETGKSSILQGAIGRRLGENLESVYETDEAEVGKGDVLLVYSDGITEAVNQKGRMYGEKRLLRKLKKSLNFGPEEILEVFLADVKNFCETSAFEDDVTMACLKIN